MGVLPTAKGSRSPLHLDEDGLRVCVADVSWGGGSWVLAWLVLASLKINQTDSSG